MNEIETAAERLARRKAENSRLEASKPESTRGLARVMRIEDVDLSVDVESRRWSWKGRIPRALNLISAREGTGKSAMVNWLAVQFSVGLDWPDGKPGQAGDVLILDSEDGADTKLLCLQSLGADMRRVSVSDMEMLAESKLSLADYVRWFIELNPETVFVAIDVSRDFDGRLRNDDKTLEDGLSELKSLAITKGVAIFITHHEAKGSEERVARDRSRGSTHWTAHCRNHWSLSQNPNYGPSAVTVEVGKSNWASMEERSPMIFQFESAVTEGGLSFGKLVFDRVVPSSEFQPTEPVVNVRGRKRIVEPEAITLAILETLQAAGGRMFGHMSRELKVETLPGSETWRSYCTNIVSEKLGIAAKTVYTHFSENLKDRTVGGHHFWLQKDLAQGGRWLWLVSREGAE